MPSFLRLAALLWVPLLVWWLALLPGGMSNDTFSSWGQIKSGDWTNHHPVPFTAFMWLTTLGARVPAGETLVQTLMMALALAALVRALTRRFDAGPAPTVAGVVLALAPLLGPFTVTLWKDIPETAFLLALAALLLEADIADEAPPRWWWTTLVLLTLGAALVRWNGVATVVVAAVVAALALRGRVRWQGPLVMVVTALAGFGFLRAMPSFTDVPPLPAIDTKMSKLADLAQLARSHPDAFHTRDRAVMERVAPFNAWAAKGYDCYTSDPLIYGLFLTRHLTDAVDAAAPELDGVWSRVARREPRALVATRLCRASLAWRFTSPPREVSRLHTLYPEIPDNEFGLHRQAPQPLARAARRIAETSHDPGWQVVAWRPAQWLLALPLVFALTQRRRRSWRSLVVLLAVPLGVVASFALVPAAQSARYTYAAVVICQLAVVACLAGWHRGRTRSLTSDA
jgi:hypothetical protein